MRLSNRKKAPLYNFIYTVLMMMLSAGVVGFILNEMRFNILDEKSYFLIFFPLVILLIFYLNGRQIFEYDSDGEALHFRNRNVIPFLSRPLSDEFPKYKLQSFETVQFLFYKRLYITISSKNGGSTTLIYQTSFMTKKEITDLKLSLSKVVRANNEKSTQL